MFIVNAQCFRLIKKNTAIKLIKGSSDMVIVYSSKVSWKKFAHIKRNLHKYKQPTATRH